MRLTSNSTASVGPSQGAELLTPKYGKPLCGGLKEGDSTC